MSRPDAERTLRTVSDTSMVSRSDGRNPPVGFVRPCEPTLVDRPPAGDGWLHEIKHDGFRVLAKDAASASQSITVARAHTAAALLIGTEEISDSSSRLLPRCLCPSRCSGPSNGRIWVVTAIGTVQTVEPRRSARCVALVVCSALGRRRRDQFPWQRARKVRLCS